MAALGIRAPDLIRASYAGLLRTSAHDRTSWGRVSTRPHERCRALRAGRDPPLRCRSACGDGALGGQHGGDEGEVGAAVGEDLDLLG